MQPFTLLIKPSGSDCNLDCAYCFYKNRDVEIGHGRQRMSDKVLERLIEDYLRLQLPISSFAWQGGEPTLMGLGFFKRAVELQKRFGKKGQIISNSIQTNAILLDDSWCHFLSSNKFLIGISFDGPKEINDYYRHDRSGQGTYDRIMGAVENCKKRNVKFNILVLVSNRNVQLADELFDFFVELGVRYLQFIPCVETDVESGEMKEFSVSPEQYGDFLCRIFDRWYEHGPSKLSIRDFDSILGYCVTGAHSICTFNKRCSDYIVIEHNGDAFCCDFFVEQKWRLGNIFDEPVENLEGSAKKKEFARLKEKLSSRCLACRHLDLCRGGCLKDRLAGRESTFEKQSYLCGAYKKFFEYSLGRFMEIAVSLRKR